MAAQENNKMDWAFAIKWILASEVAIFIVSYIFAGAVLLFGRVLPPTLAFVVAFALMGSVLGTVQSWAMPNFSNQSGRWVLLTMIGFAGGVIIAMLLRMNQTMWYASVGVASGLLQWMMLYHKVRWAGLWIVVNTLAWLLGALWEAWGLLLIGPITGLAMMWLLNHPKQQMING